MASDRVIHRNATFAAFECTDVGALVRKCHSIHLESGDQFRAAPPPPLTSSEYTKAYNEVKAMGARFNSERSPQETDLALFWAANYVVVWNATVRNLAAGSCGQHR